MSKAQKPSRDDLLALFRRGAPSIEANEITLIVDRKDPMFDHRVFLPVKDEDVLNIAAVGVTQPVSLRLRGDEAICVDGVQRTKRVLILNHIVGRNEYTGTLAPVLGAIKRLSNSPVGKRIVELCPSGSKLPITVHRGKDGEAYAAKVSANEYRESDPIVEKARKAQQLAKHGHEHDEIAEMFRVHVATVKRWLVMDTDKERSPRKPRAKGVRPTPKRVLEVFELVEDGWTEKEGALLQWVLGKITREELEAHFPKLRRAIEAASASSAEEAA